MTHRHQRMLATIPAVRPGRGNLDLLALFADPEPWMAEGICAQADPDAWFPEKGGTTQPAKRICVECPVRAKCLCETCRGNWHAARVGAEPQRFGWGPLDWPLSSGDLEMAVYGEAWYELVHGPNGTTLRPLPAVPRVTFEVNTQPLIEGFQRLERSLQAVFEAAEPLVPLFAGLARASGRDDRVQHALELRRNRNTGPPCRQRAPRRIDSGGTR